jgi:hypothetical protein
MATEETIILIACAIYAVIVVYAFVKADAIGEHLHKLADRIL